MDESWQHIKNTFLAICFLLNIIRFIIYLHLERENLHKFTFQSNCPNFRINLCNVCYCVKREKTVSVRLLQLLMKNIFSFLQNDLALLFKITVLLAYDIAHGTRIPFESKFSIPETNFFVCVKKHFFENRSTKKMKL